MSWPTGDSVCASPKPGEFGSAWREPKWDEVLSKLSPAPTQDGLYLFQDGCTDTFTNWNWEHPALIGALGVQPGDGIDRETMHRTLRKVMEVWQWDRAWGWDFPDDRDVRCARGRAGVCDQALLIDTPKNRYHPNGHVYQRPGLTAYLPANGGLLAADRADGRGMGRWPFGCAGISQGWEMVGALRRIESLDVTANRCPPLPPIQFQPPGVNADNPRLIVVVPARKHLRGLSDRKLGPIESMR